MLFYSSRLIYIALFGNREYRRVTVYVCTSICLCINTNNTLTVSRETDIMYIYLSDQQNLLISLFNEALHAESE